MARRHVPTTLAIIVLWSLSFGCCRATPKCFFPNGDSSPSDHAPCDSNAGASVCCSTGFECTSNGLCVDPRYSNFQRVLRGGCTDESWGGDCPAFCKDRYPEGDAAVYYCGDGKYCCDSQDCCNDNNASVLTLGAPKVTAIAGEAGVQASELAQAPTVQPGTPSQQASSAQGGTSHAVVLSKPAQNNPGTTIISAITATDKTASASPAVTLIVVSNRTILATLTSTIPSIATAPTSVPGPDPQKGTSNTVAIAAGVGTGVGIAIIAACIAIVFFMRRRRRGNTQQRGLMQDPGSEGDASSSLEQDQYAYPRYGRGSGDLVELNAERMVELDAKRPIQELDGEGVEKVEVGEMKA